MSTAIIQVYLGPFVHSLSKSDPYVIVPNGVIGVQDGRVSLIDFQFLVFTESVIAHSNN